MPAESPTTMDSERRPPRSKSPVRDVAWCLRGALTKRLVARHVARGCFAQSSRTKRRELAGGAEVRWIGVNQRLFHLLSCASVCKNSSWSPGLSTAGSRLAQKLCVCDVLGSTQIRCIWILDSLVSPKAKNLSCDCKLHGRVVSAADPQCELSGESSGVRQ